jgi:hypothetical protein
VFLVVLVVHTTKLPLLGSSLCVYYISYQSSAKPQYLVSYYILYLSIYSYTISCYYYISYLYLLPDPRCSGTVYCGIAYVYPLYLGYYILYLYSFILLYIVLRYLVPLHLLRHYISYLLYLVCTIGYGTISRTS